MTKKGSASGTRLRAVNIALALAIVLVPAVVAQAQSYSVLYNFKNGSDGGYPDLGSLVQNKAGNLYGTTYEGGNIDCGTVFKVVPKTGTETVLYNFTCGDDGGFPIGTLFLSGTTLYGTATYGGSSSNGVVFTVHIKTGTEKVLYTFTGGADGGSPEGGPILSKGVLYGTAKSGGTAGYGVVYKLVVNTGKETVLHNFSYADGGAPLASLTLDSTGKVLYGTTPEGGSGYDGVVFSLTISTGAYKVLYNFTGGADGGFPYGALALDAANNLYGTTLWYGSSTYGTVFKVVPKTAKETVLYNFTGGADGGNPMGGVVRSNTGNLYGTTDAGGHNGYGTVFELVKGKETVLHSFDYSHGANPYAAVIRDAKGDLFGTGEDGGSGTAGVVWEITP
jgi:uncharacterized repeat protein (TIGR03803 family)